MPQARDTRRWPRPKRAILIVLDSVGTGELPDAALYGDQGSDTLGHIAQAVGLRVPTLRRLGLDRVSGVPAIGAVEPIGAFGRMAARFADQHLVDSLAREIGQGAPSGSRPS